MRHPEAADVDLRARVEERRQAYLGPHGTRWGKNFGWLLRLDEANGQRHYRDLPAGTIYAEAVRLRDEELYARGSPYVSAWLIMKGFGSS
jgi:hypothetical protein